MRIRDRIFLAFAPVVIAGFYLLLAWISRDIRPQPLKAMEESLVDTANILAALLEGRAGVAGAPDPTDLRAVLDRAGRKQFAATIYELGKTNVNLRVYVTDAAGKVIFDSDGGKAEGQDYSRWNDVYLTLQGKYGARATRTNPEDFYSTVIYVAAPVVIGGKTAGVVTVAKPTESVKLFITRTSRKIVLAGLIVGLAVALVSLLLAHWLTRPIKRLTAYAVAVRNGERAAPPELGRGEMAVMGRALEEMRDALEGKKYIEEYIQALTHEIKAPLTSIRGAAELLQEEMPAENRARFLGNIQRESLRLQGLADRLLTLAQLETRKGLAEAAPVDLADVARDVAEDARPQLEQKGSPGEPGGRGRAGAGRAIPAAPGGGQPPAERHRFHPRRRDDHAGGHRQPWRRHPDSRGHRPGRARLRPGARLRKILFPPAARHAAEELRPRPGHRARGGRAARRDRHAGEPPRRRRPRHPHLSSSDLARQDGRQSIFHFPLGIFHWSFQRFRPFAGIGSEMKNDKRPMADGKWIPSHGIHKDSPPGSNFRHASRR